MKDKILNILKKNGFLIILFICVCVVALSTIFISTRELVGKQDGKGQKKELALLKELEKEELENKNEFVGESIENIIQGESIEAELFEEESGEEESLEMEEVVDVG